MGVKKILAWDTSSLQGIVTAFEIDGTSVREVVSWSLSLETSRHSERLLWSIDTVLQSANWKLKDLSGFAVGVGPGSFTGLRIGITTAKMLASTLKIPVAPISSLALLAQNFIEMALPRSLETDKTLIIACTDATKGEWFTLMGDAHSIRKGEVSAVFEGVLPPAELFERIQNKLKSSGDQLRWVAIGQSVERYPDLWKTFPEEKRLIPISESFHKINPHCLTQLAATAILQGAVVPAASLQPHYARDSEAEVKYKKGLLKVIPLSIP